MDLWYLAVWFQIFGLLKISLGLDRDLSCAVCRALIDEVSYSIGKEDPKKMLQVGSFRIDSKGNQGTYQRPYAKSEVHLIEVFENICENFRDYAQTTDDAGKKSVGRINARDGKTLELKGISISADVQKQLKHKCETLVEEYEDDMISMFRQDNVADIEQIICEEIAGECSAQQLAVPMPQTEVSAADAELRAKEDEDDLTEPSTTDEMVDDNVESAENTSNTDRQEL